MQDNDVQNDMDSEQHTPRRHFAMEEMVFIPLVLLSLIGIAITSFSTRDGYAYWLLMVLLDLQVFNFSSREISPQLRYCREAVGSMRPKSRPTICLPEGVNWKTSPTSAANSLSFSAGL